jgi:hypothetical protein
MRIRTARQKAEAQFPGRRSVENLGQDRRRVVVSYD